MIIKFHIVISPFYHWTDSAIAGLVGQKTKVAGCPAEVIHAERSTVNNNLIEVSAKVDSAYDSYLKFITIFKTNDLESISFHPPEE